ncbi:MAG TPA: serine/threonine-protein kinase [Dermatophilaceae bacterium]|nr:serine/threonine-protein kinase [Dermatophilaceae bacterium]
MSQTPPDSGAVRRLGGRYRLDGPLGRGGMAVVWRATDELLGREVAVKTLDLTGPDSENAGERFRREARATAALNHPNIVTVYDTGVEGETAYLVMELLPGPTLAQRLAEGHLFPVPAVRAIGAQVCAALSAAHGAGIVHRDVKPGNIAYAADGTVKVLDFGITQILDEALGHHRLTMTNTVIGTAEYLAPEQASGGRVDERADLYALGCVLFALLTGDPPFRAPEPVAVLMAHATKPAPDVRDRRPDTPPDLAALVAVLLAKDPADRPGSAAEVAEHLRARTAPATEVLAPLAATTAAPAPAPVTEPVAAARAEERHGARRWVPWLVLALLVAGVTAYLLTRPDDGTGAGTSPPATSAPVTTAPSPTTEASTPTSTTTVTRTQTPTQSASPTTTASSPTPPGTTAAQVLAAADAFGQSAQATTASGDLRGGAAQAVPRHLADLRKAVGDADRKEATAALERIDAALADATAAGELSRAGAEALATPFTTLQRAVSSWNP